MANGTYTYSRTDIKSTFRDVFYAYGPVIRNATGIIASKNMSYDSARQCITIQNLTGQPASVKTLVVLKGDVYTEEGYYTLATNKMENSCRGYLDVRNNLWKFEGGLLCASEDSFKYRCEGTRKK